MPPKPCQHGDKIGELEVEVERLKGLTCLVCGRNEPCDLNTNKDNDPNWPGSPCTFDPSPIDAAQRFRSQRNEAQAQLFQAYSQLAYNWEFYHSCPCGARSESLDTHSHVEACPTAAAVVWQRDTIGVTKV